MLDIIVIVLCALLFLIYYFINGQKGNISASRPVESRVDEYLDRRFQYMCDLCSTPHPKSGLRQCVLCRRWACENCWKEKFSTCKSCAGIIKIHTLE